MTRPSAPNPWATEGGQAAGGTDFTVAASANPTAGFPARRARPLVRHWLPSPHPTLVSGFLPGARENNSGKTALPNQALGALGRLFDGEFRKRHDGEIPNHHEPDHREAGNVRIGRCTSVMVAQG
ncbi:predicted protein [Chaetomium globosum CBS 148.51]|uniref:Uncharacterized protein n=1 Tax=Chaetomium globosum (strain ATCC 6205 / CBS 148.51 / DSM 1962 / NBRC 6347 / NRRL 1970) TaxID=306901 RepID=Q2H5J5_CHAGB|nr:uncharacterized protein CHGG_06070 [Chaetomium globosum CBS 148.51]EAQ89451.1 predicted protein [Chaetomium globosum CBS 148.51]